MSRNGFFARLLEVRVEASLVVLVPRVTHVAWLPLDQRRLSHGDSTWCEVGFRRGDRRLQRHSLGVCQKPHYGKSGQSVPPEMSLGRGSISRHELQ